jgi:hypothetical protein
VNEQLVSVDLTESERDLLTRGLLEWIGPARPTEELAVALGFRGIADLLGDTQRLRAALKDEQPLSALDWARALAATEIAFASDVFGSGYEWSTTAGLSDIATLSTLRGLQQKLVRIVAPAVGTTLGAGPSRL